MAPAFEPVAWWEVAMYRQARPGSIALQTAAVDVWRHRGVFDLGVYSRRRVAGSTVWSTHAAGRAGDIGLHDPNVGGEIMLRLVAAADLLGVCEVIYNRRRWTGDRGTRPYSGLDAHRTHLHWTQTRRAAGDRSDRAALVRLFRAALSS